jgi:hypothetical protein
LSLEAILALGMHRILDIGTDFAGYGTGYLVQAGYLISGPFST